MKVWPKPYSSSNFTNVIDVNRVGMFRIMYVVIPVSLGGGGGGSGGLTSSCRVKFFKSGQEEVLRMGGLHPFFSTLSNSRKELRTITLIRSVLILVVRGITRVRESSSTRHWSRQTTPFSSSGSLGLQAAITDGREGVGSKPGLVFRKVIRVIIAFETLRGGGRTQDKNEFKILHTTRFRCIRKNRTITTLIVQERSLKRPIFSPPVDFFSDYDEGDTDDYERS